MIMVIAPNRRYLDELAKLRRAERAIPAELSVASSSAAGDLDAEMSAADERQGAESSEPGSDPTAAEANVETETAATAATDEG